MTLYIPSTESPFTLLRAMIISKKRIDAINLRLLLQINKLKAALANADAVLIGAGAGLSASAGLTYGGERFFKYFADFHAKYGITDI